MSIVARLLERGSRPGSFSREVLGSLAVDLAITAMTLVSGILLARLLGPQGRGALAAIQALPFIVGGLGMLGLQDAVVYFAGRDREGVGRYVVSATILISLAGVPIVAVAAWLTPLFLRSQPDEVIFASRVYLLILFVNALSGLSVVTARAVHDIPLWNRLRALPPSLWVLTVVAFAVAGAGNPAAIAYAYLGGFFLLSLILVVPVRDRLRRGLPPRTSLWGPMLRYGLPSAAGIAPQFMNQRLDQLLIAGMLPPRELGFYAVAFSWSSLAMIPGAAMQAVAFSKIAGMPDRSSQARFIRKASIAVLGVSLAAAVALALLAPLAIPLIFTVEFRAAVGISLVLLGSAVARAVSRMLQSAMKGIGAPSGVMYAEWSGLICLVVAAPLAIPRYETMGAGLAVLLASAASLLVSVVFLARRIRSIPPDPPPSTPPA